MNQTLRLGLATALLTALITLLARLELSPEAYRAVLWQAVGGDG